MQNDTEKFAIPKEYEGVLMHSLMDTRRMEINGVTGWDVVAQINNTKWYSDTHVHFALCVEHCMFLAHLAIGLFPALQSSKDMLNKYQEALAICTETVQRQNALIDDLENAIVRQDRLVSKYEHAIRCVI